MTALTINVIDGLLNVFQNEVEIKKQDVDDVKSNYEEFVAQNASQPVLKDETELELPNIVLQLYNHKAKYTIDNKTGSVTFYPSPHLKESEYGTNIFSTEKFANSAQLKHFVTKLGCNSIEAMYDWNAEIIKKKDSFNGFVRAMEIAYFEHYPIRIKVSHIWLLIMQALTAHIDTNAEKLRSKYVNHNGKKDLIVNRPGFVKGSRKNNWTHVINEFAQQIDKNTVDNIVKLLENDFSVTTNLEKIASKVCLMDACKHYFTYISRCGCGFPAVTLDGSKQDWINLKKKVELLFKDKVDKTWANKWEISLFDILDRFIGVYDGEIDCLFWNSMVRRGKSRPSFGMGPSDHNSADETAYFSGWIDILFPYVMKSGRCRGGYYNRGHGNQETAGFQESWGFDKPYSIDQYTGGSSRGYGRYGHVQDPLKKVLSHTSRIQGFPIGLANAPVIFEEVNTGKKYDLKFASGFIGVEQNVETLEISPKIGWFIAEK